MNSATRHVMKMGEIRRYDEKLVGLIRHMSEELFKSIGIPKMIFPLDPMSRKSDEEIVEWLKIGELSIDEFIVRTVRLAKDYGANS